MLSLVTVWWFVLPGTLTNRMTAMAQHVWIISTLAFLLKESLSLEITSVKSPKYAELGKSALLECVYDLQGDTLYSVKWYKGRKEFVRYMPSSTYPKEDPTTAFPTTGITLDLTQSVQSSEMSQIFLSNINWNSNGTYRCEVSTDAPNFITLSRKFDVLIADPPKEQPSISGALESYEVKDIANLNCSSSKAIPEPSLEWFINKKRVNERHVVKYHLSPDMNGYRMSILGLKLQVTEEDFVNDTMVIECRERIEPIHYSSTIHIAKNHKYPRTEAGRMNYQGQNSGFTSSSTSLNVISTIVLKAIMIPILFTTL